MGGRSISTIPCDRLDLSQNSTDMPNLFHPTYFWVSNFKIDWEVECRSWPIKQKLMKNIEVWCSLNWPGISNIHVLDLSGIPFSLRHTHSENLSICQKKICLEDTCEAKRLKAKNTFWFTDWWKVDWHSPRPQTARRFGQVTTGQNRAGCLGTSARWKQCVISFYPGRPSNNTIPHFDRTHHCIRCLSSF